MQLNLLLIKVFDLEESQVRTLFEKLPRIELRQTDAVKEIFYTNSKISKTKLIVYFLGYNPWIVIKIPSGQLYWVKH